MAWAFCAAVVVQMRLAGAGGGSCCEGADLDEVVSEDAVSAPGSGHADAGEFGAVPAVAALDVVDPSFGSGAPFDLLPEGSTVLELAPCGSRFALARDRHAAHAELVQVALHRCLAIAAIGGHRAGRVSGSGGDPFDVRGQLGGVWRVTHLGAVVEEIPVVVSHICCL